MTSFKLITSPRSHLHTVTPELGRQHKNWGVPDSPYNIVAPQVSPFLPPSLLGSRVPSVFGDSDAHVHRLARSQVQPGGKLPPALWVAWGPHPALPQRAGPGATAQVEGCRAEGKCPKGTAKAAGC